LIGASVAWGVDTTGARAATSQDWSPFVLVVGLLLVGMVADSDGVFSAAGCRLARAAPNGLVLYAGSMALVAVVTALLNLDTSVAFLTPVLLYAARIRGQDEAPLLYGCVLVSNAASLLLPGSNLTNLIVLGHLHLSGAHFFSRTAPAWAVVVVLTAGVVGVAEHRKLRAPKIESTPSERAVLGLGVLAVAAAGVFVLVLRSSALYVAGVGAVAMCVHLVTRRERLERVLDVLGVPVLVGLFGTAVALGTLGRAWSGPSTLMTHFGDFATAFFAAGGSVVFNNLPAASLLASRVPPHPFALLVGLDVGPNLFVTGSLAWIIWLRSARAAGAYPSIARASALGACSAPVSIAAAGAVLTLTQLH